MLTLFLNAILRATTLCLLKDFFCDEWFFLVVLEIIAEFEEIKSLANVGATREWVCHPLTSVENDSPTFFPEVFLHNCHRRTDIMIVWNVFNNTTTSDMMVKAMCGGRFEVQIDCKRIVGRYRTQQNVTGLAWRDVTWSVCVCVCVCVSTYNLSRKTTFVCFNLLVMISKYNI
jgi:hypothetical protein